MHALSFLCVINMLMSDDEVLFFCTVCLTLTRSTFHKKHFITQLSYRSGVLCGRQSISSIKTSKWNRIRNRLGCRLSTAALWRARLMKSDSSVTFYLSSCCKSTGSGCYQPHNLTPDPLWSTSCLNPVLHTSHISSPSHYLLFATHAHATAACFAAVPKLFRLFLISLSQLIT